MQTRSLPSEFWAAAAALIAGAVALAKKFLPRQNKPKPEYITRAEFHDGMDKIRDRISVLAEKIAQQHEQVLTKLDHQGAIFEYRLDSLEASLARVDERTKTL